MTRTTTVHAPADPLETRLAGLAAAAPAGVTHAALVEVGLTDDYAAMDSPLGRILVAWNGRGVSWVSLAADEAGFEERFCLDTGRTASRAKALPADLEGRIARRLGGDRRVRIEVDLRGRTDFEVAVWMKALEIPHGEIRPYGWIAAEIGRPKAVRAVGTALAHNPVPLVVPCHRVVRSDGTLGRYSMGGPEAKRRILAAEGLDPDAVEAEARAGIRYVGSDTTHIVCLPTCRDARRITEPHRVPFKSLGAATGSGYRPFHHCRPTTLAA